MTKSTEASEFPMESSISARLVEAALLDEALRMACAVAQDADQDAQLARPRYRASRIGRVEISEARAPAVILRSGAHEQRSGRVLVMLLLSGSSLIKKSGRAVRLGPSELCIMRSGPPLVIEQKDAFHAMLLSVPESDLADRVPDWSGARLEPISSISGAPAIFRDALQSLQRWGPSLGDQGGDRIGDALVDLLGAVICHAIPNRTDCIQRSLYHMERIKKFARLNLGNPDLSVELIAESVGLSERQIHRLFASEQLSLMRWVWLQRLERCYEELLADAHEQRSISEIAFHWGFNDQAHFSRAFRKQFGLSPREARRGST